MRHRGQKYSRRVLGLGLLLAFAFSGYGQETSQWSIGGQAGFSIGMSEEEQLFVEEVSLLVLAQICNWGFQVESGFDGAIFNDLTVAANGPLGPAAISTSLALDPDETALESWTTGVSFDILGMTASASLYLLDPQTSSYVQAELSGGSECLQIRLSSRYGAWPLCFWDLRANAAWSTAPCGFGVAVSTGFSDASGFAGFDIALTEMPLFAEPVFGLAATMDLVLRFAEEEKTASPTLKMALDWIACPELSLLGEIVFDQSIPRLDGISVYGLVGELVFDNGVTFFLRESFLEEKDATVIGQAGYFESFGIIGPLPGCCNASGEFEVETLFLRDSATASTLFDWGMTTVSAEVPISETISIFADVRFQSAAASPSWMGTAGFNLLW